MIERALVIIMAVGLLAGCQGVSASEVINSPSVAHRSLQILAPTTTPTLTPTLPPTETPVPSPTPIEIPEYEGFELVWHDEFVGDAINPANWRFDTGGYGFGNEELQYYTDRLENAWVENGFLVIQARAESYENSSYTSAKLLSMGLQEFQYGRIEARTKVPAGAGLWPAFWMMGSNFDLWLENNIYTSNWPYCGEIDIMEYVGVEPNQIFGTAHGPGYAGASAIGGQSLQDFRIADNFHTYAIEWDKAGITWFFDDQPYFTLHREDIGGGEWVFDQPFFLILNLAVGGNFAGPVDPETQFPANYYIDYVRVYQAAK